MALQTIANKLISTYGHIQRRLLAASLLGRYLGSARLEIQPDRQETSHGYTYEVYKPQRPFRKIVMLVYGFTIAGERECRVVRFAQSLAAAGFQVIVPVLPGISSINLEKRDLEIMVDVIRCMLAMTKIPVGIIGFSVGGGLALVAATDPIFQGYIDPILLIGPYYSLPEFWNELWCSDAHSPTTHQEWNDFIWQQLCMAYRSYATLNFSVEELDEINQILQVYCFETSLAHKVDVYERLVKPRGLFDPRNIPMDVNVLEDLSPRNKLGRLPARVLIIHDPHDPLIPAKQPQEMLAELQKRNIPNRERLLITSTFSHISPRTVFKLSDQLATMDIFGELFYDR